MSEEELKKIDSFINKIQKRGFNLLSYPKEYFFGKSIEKDNYNIELQIEFDNNFEFKISNINVFVENPYICKEEINRIYDSLIKDIEEIKKIQIELLESFNFTR